MSQEEGAGEAKESRFGHLLQPIRDLAQNWNIDVASELEEYLSEVGNPPGWTPSHFRSVCFWLGELHTHARGTDAAGRLRRCSSSLTEPVRLSTSPRLPCSSRAPPASTERRCPCESARVWCVGLRKCG
jgi:hypothetical protein